MKFDINKLTIIDLISEKHAYLRKTVEESWKQESDVHFSHAEWHLLAKIEQQSLSISKAAGIVGITRQAMQKSVQKLESMGYVSSRFIDGNKRDKILFLTKTGKNYCEKNNQMKIQMEEKLVKLLGKDEIDKLKLLFRKEWIIE